MASRDRHRKASLRKSVALFVAFVVLAVGGFLAVQRIEDSEYRQQRGEMSEGFGSLPTFERDGQKFRIKPDLTSMLFIGYDKETAEAGVGFRSGGQADFLVLVVMDHHNGKVYPLQIDRDTMAEVTVLGFTGNEAGTRTMQICLSHGFGENIERNNDLTVKAVQNLLQGVPIDHYLSMNIASIPVLNEALGGVEVTVPYDMSNVDSLMTAGATLKLHGKQAETFVRSRLDVGDGTNESRMLRQRIYLDAARDETLKRLRADKGFASKLYQAIIDVLDTNMTRGKMINEMNHLSTYSVEPMALLEGEHTIGNDGFVEFHAREQSILDWVTEAFYTPVG